MIPCPILHVFIIKGNKARLSIETPPPGSLHVGQLAKRRPHWKVPCALSEQPKSLILADWTASAWSEKKIKAVITKMEQLLADGFTLYLWQGDQAIPLTAKSLKSLENKLVRGAMAPIAPETIINSAL